jgi:Rieske Fe-S protein
MSSRAFPLPPGEGAAKRRVRAGAPSSGPSGHLLPEGEGLIRHFPVSSEEDSFITRREFTKFLGLTSIAFFAGTLMAAGRKLWKRVAARDTAGTQVTTIDEVSVGGYKLFRYPTENDPCILLRLEPQKFVAFNQNCTHLSCPVLFNASSRQLECPCHKGFFSAEDGRVLTGPPKRPLEALSVSVRGDRIWVKHESES